jgi:hypothetical protein
MHAKAGQKMLTQPKTNIQNPSNAGTMHRYAIQHVCSFCSLIIEFSLLVAVKEGRY